MHRSAPAILLGLLTSPSALAHHSFAAVFDLTSTEELEGEITATLWRNPHVRFDVRTADGEVWRIETQSVSILQRMELTAEVLGAGERVRLAGHPARDGSHQLFALNALLADGREVVLRPGTPPRWSKELRGTSATWLARGTANAEAERLGIFRVWSTHFTDASRQLWADTYPLTPAAAAARAAFDPIADYPLADCAPKGMPWIMEQPYPMEFVRDGASVLLRLEEYDTVRTIHMDTEMPEDAPRHRLGYSVGRWDGDVLLVTTRHISYPYFNATGIPQSEAIELVERFAPSADGSELSYTLTVTDPATFTQPVVLDKRWVWRPGEAVEPYACTTGR